MGSREETVSSRCGLEISTMLADRVCSTGFLIKLSRKWGPSDSCGILPVGVDISTRSERVWVAWVWAVGCCGLLSRWPPPQDRGAHSSRCWECCNVRGSQLTPFQKLPLWEGECATQVYTPARGSPHLMMSQAWGVWGRLWRAISAPELFWGVASAVTLQFSPAQSWVFLMPYGVAPDSNYQWTSCTQIFTSVCFLGNPTHTTHTFLCRLSWINMCLPACCAYYCHSYSWIEYYINKFIMETERWFLFLWKPRMMLWEDMIMAIHGERLGIGKKQNCVQVFGT